jgi:phosphonate transport system substrate-binding protein
MEPTAPKRRSNSPLYALIAVIAVALFGIVIYLQIQTLSRQRINADNELSLRLIGLSRPVVNKLADTFTDVNGNLVADAPTDPAKQIDPPTLTFSFVATENPDQYKDAFKELMTAITLATGKTVEYLPIEKTEDELKALSDGKLHIAAFGTGTVPTAVDACGFVPVCRLGGGKEEGYHMLIIVPANSDLQHLPDLKGHELGVTEPSSNSGYKAALVLLSQDVGLLPGRDFSLRFSGGQDASIAHIADGSYQAAAVASDVLDRAVAQGKIKPSQYREIYRSELFPTAALGYVYNLKPELAAEIKNVLLNFPWQGSGLEKLLGPSGQNKFVPVNYKNDWALVRRIDDAMGEAHVVK